MHIAARAASSPVPEMQPDQPHQTTATLSFIGELNAQRFSEFCAHRAQRLSLDHSIIEQSPTRVDVSLHGHATLIDMFEMACSLGPEGSVVLTTARKAA